jgi:hypothetical protein
MSKREMAEVEATRKGTFIYMGGKPYRYGHTYKVMYRECEYVGTLSWAAVANPKPCLHIVNPLTGEPEFRRLEFWNTLTYVSE